MAIQSDQKDLYLGVRVVALTLCGISMSITFGIILWIYFNRQTRVIKASQPFFLYLFCFGLILKASSTIPHTFDAIVASPHECTIACNAFVWLFVLGWGICLSALQAKLHRINKIMNSAQHFKRVNITVCDTLTPVACLVGSECMSCRFITWGEDFFGLGPILFSHHALASYFSYNSTYNHPHRHVSEKSNPICCK